MDMLAALFVLGICSALALGNDVKLAAPEDIDGSGDDGDYSGSGAYESKTVNDFSTPAPPLVSLEPHMPSTVQQPDILVKVETEVEDTMKVEQTTKLQDLIAGDQTTQEGTTLVQTTQDSSTDEFIDDEKKHHHHHHHPHPHHHTTTPSTTLPVSDGHNENKTIIPVEAEEHHVQPVEPTTSTAAEDSEMENVIQKATTPAVLIQHGVQDTTSGSTSTPYADIEGPNADTDEATILVNADLTTVAGSTTDKDHHPHHHHHHHHEHTTSSIDGINVHEETSTKPSDKIESFEDIFLQGEPTTSSEDNKHHHHHHTTTPNATQPTDLEKPLMAHTEAPKGRGANVPFAKATTPIPVISEEEHIPEGVEPADLSTSSTLQDKTSVTSVQDENEDSMDSKEEDDSSGEDPDFFIEVTAPQIINRARPQSEDGSDASHGIMERKELLAGIIAGGLAGLVFAAALVAFVMYRMKKKDEGSYSLEEPKQSNGGYQKPREQREFYA